MSFCPHKFILKLSESQRNGTDMVDSDLWQCEGLDCEFFNPNYGRCCRYVESLTIDERVELEKKNGKKI